MKVRFNLKDSGGLILLKFRYLNGALPFVFSTRQHVSPKDWNKKTMRAIVRNALTSPHLADLNSLLQRMEDEVLSVYRQHVGKVALSGELFRDRLNDVFFGQVAETFTLISFIETEMMGMKRKPETLANYRHVANVLSEFKSARRASISLDNIDFEWLENFKNWCFDRNYSTATVGKFVSVIKAAVNMARRMDLTKNKTVTERGFSVKKTPGNRKKLALYAHEVDAIAAIEWSDIDNFEGMTGARLQKVADVILAGCSTGLRHSDFSKVDKSSVVTFRDRQIVQLWTKKTGKPVAIPMDGRLRALLERYGYQLPVISRSEMLVVGRMVLKYAGIDREVTVRETTGNRERFVSYPFWQKFSAHVTRRTFARNAYLADASLLPAIQAILGHSTQAQTLEYIDVEGMLTAEHFAKRMEMNETRLRAVK